jgi:pteridine reductase
VQQDPTTPQTSQPLTATTREPPSLAEKREAATQGTLLLLLLLALAVVMLATLALVMFLRRERHLRTAETRPAAIPPRRDAWAEAGRRIDAPAAHELEAPADLMSPDNEKTWTAMTPTQQVAPPVPRRSAPLALVTGGARRVGRTICLELARAGCDVMFTYNSSEDDAASLCKEIAAMRREATSFRVDLSNPDAVEAVATQWAQTLQRLDVLVHNASAYEPSPVATLSAEAAQRQYQINALTPLVLSARLAPLLRASVLSGGGAIVAMGDIHAMSRPRKDFVAYTMSKAALTEMVHCLARDLAPGVRVNAVAPGVVAWPAAGHESTADEQLKYLRRIPLGRAGEPADAALAVRWLALEATYITGQVLRVDGGRYLT